MTKYLVVKVDGELSTKIPIEDIHHETIIKHGPVEISVVGETEDEQVQTTKTWDPMVHEHIAGFHDHRHPHRKSYHSNMNGFAGSGKDTGFTTVTVEGAAPAIVGEPPDMT